MLLLAAAKKQFELVDGSDAEQKDKRNKLFEISGKRAVYPQVWFVRCASSSHHSHQTGITRDSQAFVQKGDDITFIGDYDAIEASFGRDNVVCFESRFSSQALVESNEELKGLDKALEGVANAE